MKHTFEVSINWETGRNGVGQLTARDLQTKVSIPHEMSGPNIGTNPDEMLIGAASTCYIISLATLLENANLSPSLLKVVSEGIVDVSGHVFTFEEIIHHINISFEGAYQVDQVKRLAQKAEEICMISKALRGNVKIKLILNIL